jgi:hypothetical protein
LRSHRINFKRKLLKEMLETIGAIMMAALFAKIILNIYLVSKVKVNYRRSNFKIVWFPVTESVPENYRTLKLIINILFVIFVVGFIGFFIMQQII